MIFNNSIKLLFKKHLNIKKIIRILEVIDNLIIKIICQISRIIIRAIIQTTLKFKIYQTKT